MIHKASKFTALSFTEQFLCLEASFWLGFFKITLALVPFRFLAPFLGKQMGCAKADGQNHSPLPLLIPKVIGRMSFHLPWESKCLVKAAAGKVMLRVRGIQSTLYLGVARKGEQELAAHAWLKYGDQVIIGGRGKKGYTVISTFS